MADPYLATESANVGSGDRLANSKVERPSGIPRALKVAAAVVPIAATFCAGIWAVVTQFAELEKSLAKEATEQEHVRLDQEREKTTRSQLENSQSEAEKAVQSLKTEEQQSRERVSRLELEEKEAEIKRAAETERLQLEEKEAEIKRAVETERLAAQSRDDQAFASAIGEVLALEDKPDTNAALASLLRYVDVQRYRPEIVAALTARAERLKSIEQAQLWLRVAKAVVPADTDLLVSVNRTARSRVERYTVGEFWALYANHTKEMPPLGFLDEALRTGTLAVAGSNSPAARAIKASIDEHFPEHPLDSQIVGQRVPDIVKQVSADALSAQIYGLVLEQTGDLIVRYIDGLSTPNEIDLSNCYLPRLPREPGQKLHGEDLYVR